MAQRHIVQLIDDLDGTPLDDGAGSTVAFALEGRNYEIDLSRENLDRLRSALQPYIRAARTTATASRGRGSGKRSSRNSSAELQAIRVWAAANGYRVGDRGRIPETIREAYAAAH
ncbi:MAG: Lsr2 family protein [Microbacteriaceae bacterium]|nr:Lsr2 family protein [Microbacteriaceae bacterium]